MNTVHLLGNMTRDIELRQAGSTTVGGFGIAINRRYKAGDGEQREETIFIDCEAWGRTAEVIAEHLGKGRKILLEGRLKSDEWEDKTTGQKRTKLKVVVDKFHFVDSASAGESKPAPRSTQSNAQRRKSAPGAYDAPPALEESGLPF